MEFKVDETVEDQEQSLVRASRAMDIIRAKELLSPYLAKVQAVKKELDDLVVQDDDSNRRCVEIGASSHSLLKAIEKRRDSIIDIPNTFVKNVKNLTKDFEAVLKATKEGAAVKIKRYTAFQEQQRREEQMRLQREQEKLQEALKKDAETKGVDMVTLPPVYVPEVPKAVHTDMGSQSSREHYSFRVTEFKDIPANYLEINEKAVRAAIKQGLRGNDIPGILIYRDDTIAFRE